MPRRSRICLPGQPQHIVVRGHNRDPIVARRADYRACVGYLAEALHRYKVSLHAWVLMTNHFHLLATPEDETGLPRAMQWLGSHYARYFNRCYRRRGSIWEGRYKSSLVDTERYLLLCYRYVELNPVRAGMVQRPEQYPWSSYLMNAWGGEYGVGAEAPTPRSPGVGACAPTPDVPRAPTPGSYLPVLTPHAVFLALGRSDATRQAAYRSLFGEVLDRRLLTIFRRGVEKQQPVGHPGFMLKIARMRQN